MSEKHKSIVHDLKVASPCETPWDSMHGDGRTRICASCDQRVFNLTDMPLEEAEKLVAGFGQQSKCLYRRTDGTVLASDCPIGSRNRTRRVKQAIMLCAAIVACGVLWGGTLRVNGEPSFFDQVGSLIRILSGSRTGGYRIHWSFG
jgi:hypothetical protein